MKLVKTASGKTNIKMSQKEWQSLGKKAGWSNPGDERSHYWRAQFEELEQLIEKAAEELERCGEETDYDIFEYEDIDVMTGHLANLLHSREFSTLEGLLDNILESCKNLNKFDQGWFWDYFNEKGIINT